MSSNCLGHYGTYIQDLLTNSSIFYPLKPILRMFLFSSFAFFIAHSDTGFPMFEVRSDNSLIVSIELNSVLYQGVLYPRGVPGHPLHSLSSRGLSAS